MGADLAHEDPADYSGPDLAEMLIRDDRAAGFHRRWLNDLLPASAVVEVEPGAMAAAIAHFRELVERGELVHDQSARFSSAAADGSPRGVDDSRLLW